MSFSSTGGGAGQGKPTTHQALECPQILWGKTWWVTKQPAEHGGPVQLQCKARLLLPTLKDS